MEKKEVAQIWFESFRHELLDSSCQKVIRVLQSLQVDSISLVALPTNTRIYCVLRSPHVDKDSREHFETRTHKRLLKVVYTPTFDVVEMIGKTNLPSGISCTVQINDF
jgi:small subunit ribosomal protein S10